MGVATSFQMASLGEPSMGAALGLWMIIFILALGMFLGFFIAAGTGGSSVVATNFVALAILCLLLGCLWTVSPKPGTHQEHTKKASTHGGATNQARRGWYELPAQD